MPDYIYEHGERKYIKGSNTDDDRAYQREWSRKRRLNPEIRKAESSRQREWQKKNPLEFSWRNSSRTAKKRGYVWELTREAFGTICTSSCVYCGAEPQPINGVDRLDNALGYTEKNSVPACATCNYAKRGMSVLDFIQWAQRLVQHQGEK